MFPAKKSASVYVSGSITGLQTKSLLSFGDMTWLSAESRSPAHASPAKAFVVWAFGHLGAFQFGCDRPPWLDAEPPRWNFGQAHPRWIFLSNPFRSCNVTVSNSNPIYPQISISSIWTSRVSVSAVACDSKMTGLRRWYDRCRSFMPYRTGRDLRPLFLRTSVLDEEGVVRRETASSVSAPNPLPCPFEHTLQPKSAMINRIL
jgi:hypothetical protein